MYVWVSDKWCSRFQWTRKSCHQSGVTSEQVFTRNYHRELARSLWLIIVLVGCTVILVFMALVFVTFNSFCLWCFRSFFRREYTVVRNNNPSPKHILTRRTELDCRFVMMVIVWMTNSVLLLSDHRKKLMHCRWMALLTRLRYVVQNAARVARSTGNTEKKRAQPSVVLPVNITFGF